MVRLHKEVLFQLMHSHSKLAQAEYDRNLSYNDSHFSAKAEKAIIDDLNSALVVEYFEYVEREAK